MILVWDPGPARTGFIMAEYLPEQRKIDIKVMSIVPGDQVKDMLGLAEGMLLPGQTHTFVIENFRVDTQARGNIFQWDDMKTSKMIGAIEYAAYRMNDSPVVLQEPGPVLSQAKRWAPFKWPKGHLPDDKSAYCHLFYWANKRGMVDTTDDLIMKGQEQLW